MEDILIYTLLQKDGQVVGALGIDLHTTQFIVFKAKAVILATGGGMRIYHYNCAAREATGDGYAMAYNAGASLQDMEFVQFFPTMMVWPKNLFAQQTPTRLRYELNAQLRNFYGERFMDRYDPVHMEKSTRDITARAIYKELKEGRGNKHGAVYLDVSYLPDQIIDSYVDRFYPIIISAASNFWKRELIFANSRWKLPPVFISLWAAYKSTKMVKPEYPDYLQPERFCGGVHGANRLGGNALPEMSVFGKRAARKAADYSLKHDAKDIDTEQVNREVRKVQSIFDRPRSKTNAYVLKKQLQQTMWEGAFVIRSEKTLSNAEKKLADIRKELPGIGLSTKTKTYNHELREIIEIGMMLDVSEMVVKAARMRTETRGAHYREDYQEQDDQNWIKNIVIRNKNGEMELTKEDVVMTKIFPGGAE